jgi:hypothetical protein
VFDYDNGVFVVAKGLDFFKPGVIVSGGRLYHQATCLMERILIEWLSGS